LPQNLDDGWWERVDLAIKIMNQYIISLLWFADTNRPTLVDVYDGWDSMIVSMKIIIMQNESPGYGNLAENLWSTIQYVMITRWHKNSKTFALLGSLLES